MKTKSLFVAVLSLVLGTSLSAQITVNQDGGVRIGTAPKSLVGGGWTLSTKGLETNVGEVKFHLDGGMLSLTGSSSVIRNGFVPGGGGSSGSAPAEVTYLTGRGLYVGTSSSLAYYVNTQNLYAQYSSQIGSDRRMKEKIKGLTDAREIVMRLQPVTYDILPGEGFAGDSMQLLLEEGSIE